MAVTTPPRGRIGTLHGATIMFAKGISSMPLAVRAPSPTVTAGESVPLLRREPEDRPPPSTRRNVSAIVAGGVLVAVRSNLPRLAPTPPLRAAAHSPAPLPLLFPSLRFSWRWCVSPRSRGAARDPPRAPAPRIANVPPRRCRTRRDATNAPPSPRRPTRTQNTNPPGDSRVFWARTRTGETPRAKPRRRVKPRAPRTNPRRLQPRALRLRRMTTRTLRRPRPRRPRMTTSRRIPPRARCPSTRAIITSPISSCSRMTSGGTGRGRRSACTSRRRIPSRPKRASEG